MPTTDPTFGWRLPELADPPDAPGQMSDLAADIADAVAFLSLLGHGLTGSTKRDVAASGTSVPLSTPLTWTLTNPLAKPVLVRAEWAQYVYMTGGADLGYLEVVVNSGGTLVTGAPFRCDYPDGETGLYYISGWAHCVARVEAGQTVTFETVGRHNGSTTGDVYVQYDGNVTAKGYGVLSA